MAAGRADAVLVFDTGTGRSRLIHVGGPPTGVAGIVR